MDIKAVVTMKEILCELLYSDQTAMKLVPSSQWTMEKKRALNK